MEVIRRWVIGKMCQHDWRPTNGQLEICLGCLNSREVYESIPVTFHSQTITTATGFPTEGMSVTEM